MYCFKKIKPALILLGCSLLFTNNRTQGQTTPNVVIIFMDDLGYGDLECYGGFPYHTPNINRLAAQGMRFTGFYAAQAVCTASRAALLTGCYPNRLGLHGALAPWSTIALQPGEETIADLLKQKGYKTGITGKWHLGHKQPFLPLQQGFDEYLGIPYSNDMWPVNYDGKPATEQTSPDKARYPPLPLIENNTKIREISTLQNQAELTTMFTQWATRFIRENKNHPFFLYVAHPMPHVPIAASEKYLNKSGGGLFGDVMEEMDWSVGEIMKTLEENGLTQNTLVIFTSDNGPWLSFGNHAGNTGGLREGKGTAFEGGLRVPCIMRWPGKIAAGSVCNNLASTLDVLPTIATICNTGMPSKKIDGVNIWPLLTQQDVPPPRDEFVYYYDVNNLKAIRKGQWKLVFPHISRSYSNTKIGNDGWPGVYARDTIPLSLYNLRSDPGEARDVKKEFPEIVQQLSALADQYRKELGDNLTNQKGSGVRPAAKMD